MSVSQTVTAGYNYDMYATPDLVDQITQLGALLVAAAGNTGARLTVGAPSNFPHVVSVGAVEPDGDKYKLYRLQSRGPADLLMKSLEIDVLWQKPDIQGITYLCTAASVFHLPFFNFIFSILLYCSSHFNCFPDNHQL
jgi:hypothetical protein